MPINASVSPVCIVSALPLDFGSYDPVGVNATAPKDGQGTVTVQCLRGSTYTLKLDLGLNGVGTARNMKGPSGTLMHYELYRDSARTTVWNTVNTVGGTAVSTAPLLVPVYGRIFPAQDVVAGAYTDTVTVTVEF